MKKLIFTLLLSSAVVSGLMAQTEKGNVLWGANVGNIQLDFQKGSTQFGIDLNPKIGYFIQDRLAIGPEVTIGYHTTSGDDIFNYGVGAFGRYYLYKGEAEVSNNSRWFIEANAGINGVNTGGSNTNGLGLGIGPGVAYFLNKNVALEALLKYNFTAGFGNSTTANRLGLGVGFQIYLPGKALRDRLK